MENVKTEIRDGLLIVTIDRPKVLNALNAQTVEEIGEAFEKARDDENVKAVIVTGGGEKAFVAGADINELAKKTPITGKTTSERGQEVFSHIPHPDAVQQQIYRQMETNHARLTGVASPRQPSVTDQIAALADLRDRGAISPAEYEAKKAQLLDRL